MLLHCPFVFIKKVIFQEIVLYRLTYVIIVVDRLDKCSTREHYLGLVLPYKLFLIVLYIHIFLAHYWSNSIITKHVIMSVAMIKPASYSKSLVYLPDCAITLEK